MLVHLPGCQIDLEREEIRTNEGERVALRPRSFAVLRMLASRPGQLVTKAEIFDHVWNNAVVTDDSLTQCIADIRRHLNDRNHSIVRTVSRRGYILEVEDSAALREQDDRKRKESARNHDPPNLTVSRPAVFRGLPPTRYARSGSRYIAYQVSGAGPIDLVFVQGYITHLDIEWEDPRPARFYERLGTFSRLIRFDKRGTGLSDRGSSLPTLEERMDDVRAVMDAAGSKRAVLFGSSEGAPMSLLFSASYPERVSSLVLYGAIARFAWAPDHPWGRTDEQMQESLRIVDEKWGTGHSVDIFAPSLASDPDYRTWRSRLDRSGASPTDVITLIRMNQGIDVRPVLSAISVPTLVLHRKDDKPISVEHGQYLAKHIANARYIELPGHDHAPWVADTESICREIESFLAGMRPNIQPDRVLTTIVFAELVANCKVHAATCGKSLMSSECRSVLLQHLEQYRGRQIEADTNGFAAVFDGPGRAVQFAQAMVQTIGSHDRALRAGVHTGEFDVWGDRLDGIAIQICMRLVEKAEPGEVLVTRTIADLVAGSALKFEARGEHTLPGIPWSLTLFAAL